MWSFGIFKGSSKTQEAASTSAPSAMSPLIPRNNRAAELPFSKSLVRPGGPKGIGDPQIANFGPDSEICLLTRPPHLALSRKGRGDCGLWPVACYLFAVVYHVSQIAGAEAVVECHRDAYPYRAGVEHGKKRGETPNWSWPRWSGSAITGVRCRPPPRAPPPFPRPR